MNNNDKINQEKTRASRAAIRVALSSLALALGFALFAGSAAGKPIRGSVCGNAILDTGEFCDDGNPEGGDGCSQSCQVEPGHVCTLPFESLGPNSADDPGFEAGTPSPAWNEASLVYGTPICKNASCPSGPGPASGDWWARFNSDDAQTELAEVGQDVLIPLGVEDLTFRLRIGECLPGIGTFSVLIDGDPVFDTTTTGSGCGTGDYTTVRIDLTSPDIGGPFNDDSIHSLRFSGVLLPSPGMADVGFSIDDIVLAKPAGPPDPSACVLESNVLFEDSFDPGVAGDLESLGYTLVELGETELRWGTTDDGFCGSGDVPPGNFTSGEGEAACIDANAAGGGQVESYLCLPELDFSTVGRTSLSFSLNYQNSGTGAAEDFFNVIVGLSPPDPGTLPGYTEVFFTDQDVGVFGEPPGVEQFVDLSVLDFQSPVWVCLGYGALRGLYAQADSINVVFEECVDDFDSDKLEGCIDNCAETMNPDQRDTDNDGIGNACDADIAPRNMNRVTLANGNDCAVNFDDLATLKQAFFSTPELQHWNPDADFNGDNAVNFQDLAFMKSSFFKAPGPSGLTNLCAP